MAAKATNAVPEVMTERELSKADQGVVAIPRVQFDDSDLLNLKSFEDALALLEAQGVEIVQAHETLGNGFVPIRDKSILVGVPMLMMGWNFNAGGNGTFVSAYVLAKIPGNTTPAKLIINDGSSGICKTLLDYTSKTGKNAGLMVKRGLSRSDYTQSYVDDNGVTQTREATTFYLDTADV